MKCLGFSPPQHDFALLEKCSGACPDPECVVLEIERATSVQECSSAGSDDFERGLPVTDVDQCMRNVHQMRVKDLRELRPLLVRCEEQLLVGSQPERGAKVFYYCAAGLL
jgi:hypothetical protein